DCIRTKMYLVVVVFCRGGGVLLGVFAGAIVAYSVSSATPPIKKLPWSSISSGFVKNFFVLLPFCATTFATTETSRTAEKTHHMTSCTKRIERTRLRMDPPIPRANFAGDCTSENGGKSPSTLAQ